MLFSLLSNITTQISSVTPAPAVIQNPLDPRFGDVFSILSSFTTFIQPLAIVALLGMLIYGGFVRLTAAGDPEKEKLSIQIIQAALIGFVIIVIAPLIVSAIGAILGIQLLG